MPLSRVQQRLLLNELGRPGLADNVMMHAYLAESIDAELLAGALSRVVAQHFLLNSRLDWTADDVPVLRPGSEPPRLDVRDLRDHSYQHGEDIPSELDGRAHAGHVLADWWEEPFQLEHQPPFRVRLVRSTGGLPDVVGLCWHHMVSDGWSARLVAQHLQEAYQVLARGMEPDWPDEVPYADFVHAESSGLPAALRKSAPFWRERLIDPAPSLFGEEDASEQAREDSILTIDAAALTAFDELSRRVRLGVLMHLGTQALAAITGHPRMRLATISNGRGQRKFRSTVGCFVNPVLVPLTLGDLADTLVVVHENLGHALPLDEVARLMPGDARRLAPVDVMVNLNDWSRVPALMLGRPVVIDAPRTAERLMLDMTREGSGPWRLRARCRAGSAASGVAKRLVSMVADALIRLSGSGRLAGLPQFEHDH